MPGADLRFAVKQSGIKVGLLQGRLDHRGEIADSRGAAGQAIERGDDVGGDSRTVEVEMLDDAQQVGIRHLEELMNPVHDFDVWIAAHLAEDGGGFDGFIAQRIELAKKGGSFDFSHEYFQFEAARTRLSAWSSNGLVLSQVVQPRRPALESCVWGTSSLSNMRLRSQEKCSPVYWRTQSLRRPKAPPEGSRRS